jgi:hypothetical protein
VNENGNLGLLEEWAQKVVEDSQSLPEDLSEDELQERQVQWYADYFVLSGSDPDDPALRGRLVDEEGMSPELADEVLAKLRQLAAAP